MADTEHKLVEDIADCDRTSEPAPKKTRSSVLQNCGSDAIHREQITCGDESGGSCAVEISVRPEDAESDMGVAQATEGAQEHNNNEPVTSELTKDHYNAEKTLMSGSESEVLGT